MLTVLGGMAAQVREVSVDWPMHSSLPEHALLTRPVPGIPAGATGSLGWLSSLPLRFKADELFLWGRP
jgi:hypothetical protein